MNSPYAAPHTPIASAKRPRISSKNSSVKSANKGCPPPNAPAQATGSTPTPNGSSSSNSQSHPTTPHQQQQHTHRHGDHGIPSPTPSKNLFSPSLRPDHPHHHHHHHYVHGHDDHGLGKHGHPGIHEAEDEDHEDENNENIYLATMVASSSSSSSPPADSSAEAARAAQARAAAAAIAAAEEEDAQESSDSESCDEDEGDEFNPYQFIAALPPHNSVCIFDKICLPPVPRSSRKPLPCLALDLDETLVHCTVEPIDKPDLIFPVTFNGVMYQVYVRKRPYLDYFLEAVSKCFEVVVFTASQKVYADVLLDRLDPERKHVRHRLFREACLLVQGNYLKDLHVLGRDPKQCVLVDNSPHAYSYQIDNGIPIESWYDDETDTELLKLIGFLKRLQGEEDFRPIVREHFKTYQLIENASKGLPISLRAPPF